MNPFEKIGQSHSALPQVDLAQGRSIASSRSTSSRLMELIDANARGTVHGGVIMRMVDEAASIVAFKHSQNPDVVTAKVETFKFLAPAYIRNVLTIHCAMHYVGRSSMEVGVEVLAEDVITGTVRHIASSNVVYVALDEHGKPTRVPPLVPADDEEKVIIERARLRRLRRQKTDEELMQVEEAKE
jgi:acyl-CoA hydrolase